LLAGASLHDDRRSPASRRACVPTTRPSPHVRPADPPAAAIRRLAQTFVIIGAVITAFGGRIVIKDRGMLGQWPMVDGEVVETAIVSTRSRAANGPSEPVYDVQVMFAYAVNGNRLQSHVDVGAKAASRDRVAELLKTYAKGSHHPIYLRPDDPSVIRFDVNRVRIFAKSGLIVLAGLAFLAFGWFLPKLASRWR
jgi:hypothetical protein